MFRSQFAVVYRAQRRVTQVPVAESSNWGCMGKCSFWKGSHCVFFSFNFGLFSTCCGISAMGYGNLAVLWLLGIY